MVVISILLCFYEACHLFRLSFYRDITAVINKDKSSKLHILSNTCPILCCFSAVKVQIILRSRSAFNMVRISIIISLVLLACFVFGRNKYLINIFHFPFLSQATIKRGVRRLCLTRLCLGEWRETQGGGQ